MVLKSIPYLIPNFLYVIQPVSNFLLHNHGYLSRFQRFILRQVVGELVEPLSNRIRENLVFAILLSPSERVIFYVSNLVLRQYFLVFLLFS